MAVDFDAEAALRRLIDIYRQGYVEILATIARKEAKGNATSFERSLLADVSAILQELDVAAREWASEVVPRVYHGAAETVYEAWTARGATPPPVSAGFAQVHRAAVQVLADNLYDNLHDALLYVGRRVRDQWRRVQLEVVTQKVVAGKTVREAKKELQRRIAEEGLGAFRDAKGRVWRLDAYAEMVARSVTAEATNLGTLNQLRGMGRDLVRITDHRAACPLCVTEDTLVSGPPPLLGIRREYRGDLVRIRTASGKHLAGTPDHAILTDTGWRMLKDIKPGDKVVCEADVNRTLHNAGIVPNYVQVPARIKDVCESLGPALRPNILAGPAACNLDSNIFDKVTFYGPAYRKVDIVRANGGLRPEHDTAAFELLCHEGLVGRIDLGLLGLGNRDATLRFLGMVTASPSLMGGPHELAPLFWSGADSPDGTRSFGGVDAPFLRGEHGSGTDNPVGTRTSWNTSTPKVVQSGAVANAESGTELGQGFSGDIAAAEFSSLGIGELSGRFLRSLGTVTSDQGSDPWNADAEGGRQLLRRLSGSVTLDDVVSVGVSQFEGHVYDLQTGPHWYVANGIISHNCAPYEGRVYSITGETPGYPKLSVVPGFSAGFQTLHPGCRHRAVPYVAELADDPEGDRRRSNRPFTDPRSEREKRAYEREQERNRLRRERRKLEQQVAILPPGEERDALREKLRKLRSEQRALGREHRQYVDEVTATA